MKKLIISLIILFALVKYSGAQTYNWAAFNETKTHTIGAEFGLDYGVSTTVRYGCYLPVFLPIMLTADFQVPFGNHFLDDNKLSAGIQLQLPDLINFKFIVGYQLTAKRFQNDYSRQYSFGNKIGITAGYYKQSWFIAGEFSYDNTSITQIHHSDTYLEYYPGAVDGWYKNMAGNFYYGLQGGYSFYKLDLVLRAGQTKDRGFGNNTLPFSVSLGVTYRF